MTTRTRLQAEWMMKIKDQVPALAPIYLWHTNAEGASSGGQAIPRVADKILQVEYQQTAQTMAERDNLARLKMWVVKGREMGSGEDTAIHLWLERAGGAIHAWNLPDQFPRICRLFPDSLYEQCGIDIRPRQLAQGDLI